MEVIRQLIEWASVAIEVLAVVFIVSAVAFLTITRGAVRYVFRPDARDTTESYKHSLSKALLPGLELLVAADVVRTVALEPTLNDVVVLGLLVAVRTFLSWSMVVEIEGRWPWQSKAQKANQPAQVAVK